MKPLPLISKTLISAGLFSLVCYSGISQAAVSQQPLMLVESVAPNLILTLDSSGSMRFGFAPDTMKDDRNTRRAKSSTYNPLYYNPEVEYRLPVKLDANGNEILGGYTTSFTNAYHNGFQTGHGTVNLSSEYRVAWDWNINTSKPDYRYSGTNTNNRVYTSYTGTGVVYRLAENPSSDFSGATQTGVPAYYYVYDESLLNCSNNINSDNCYKKVDVGADEQENFAIWYSFYRNRALATLSAANLAFNDLPSSIRFTWQDLSNCTTLNSNGCKGNYLRSYTDRHKGNFFSWLSEVKFDGGTPLRAALGRAGSFLEGNTAWAFNPNPMKANGTRDNTIQSPEFSCRPAFHIMMTDGMWNGANASPSNLRADHSSFSLPGIGNYTSSRRPFGDSTKNTLADLAMHYWATDLRPSLDNDVKPYMPFKGPNENWDPRNNPATWQHMVNYTMGLGLSQSLTATGLQWEGDTFSGGYTNLLSGARSWPAASDGDDNNVYDLWHAAINSRGEFFSVDRPEDMIQAFNDIINRIAERTATAAAAGTTTSVSPSDDPDNFSFATQNRTFLPEFNSEYWSGDIKHELITRSAEGTYTVEHKWYASAAINAQGSRNIYMGGGSGTSGLIDFTYSNLPAAMKTIFDRNPDSLSNTADNRGADRVAYLKGNRSKEGNADNQFRRRASVLGDIINATPVVVGAPEYLPYVADKIDGDSGDYLAFQQAHQGRPELIYVGANDGMLHALSTTDGREVFAFVPRAVMQHMPKLTGQSYAGGGHRFYVDGTPVVRDVYIGGTWRTVLIGTLRAGGKSLFALDITNPGADGSGVELLWEITDQTEGYENLGYSFPEPEVVRLHSGEWAVLQGNGYDSAEGVASMFIINIANGDLIKELVAEEGASGANGLSSVRGADNNGDGLVDYAYAGDLQGNLWRFDLVKTTNSDITGDPFGPTYQTGVTAANYVVSYNGNPLYRARYAGGQVQSITAPPSLVRHPTRRGYIVLFGTGKYFETDDAAPDTTKANSMYGIWDRLTKAQSGSHPSSLTRANLQAQEIVEETVTTFSNDDGPSVSRQVRYITDNDVEWYPEGTTPEQEKNNSNVQNWGWYVDLEVGSKKGEMMIQRMSARGDTLLFSSLTPNEDPCADGATYMAYAINAHTGARTRHPTFDFNQDGRHDMQDTDGTRVPSAYATESPINLSRDGSVIEIGGVVGFAAAARTHGRLTWQSMPLEVEE